MKISPEIQIWLKVEKSVSLCEDLGNFIVVGDVNST
jgi:hypothetical protein